MDASAEHWEGHIGKRNAVVFALFAMSSLRISLKKQSRQRFSVLTQDPCNQTWFEQDVILESNSNCGLPTPTDETVLLALIDMTRQQEPANQELTISKSGLLDFLKWRKWTQNKNRLEHSLRLLAQIKLTFSKGRWDKISETWIPFSFCIFDKVDIDGDNYRLEWNASVYASLRSTNYAFAFHDYQKFENAISRRVYLMTNRVLAERGSVTLVLRDFFEKVLRMHMGYSHSSMRRRLVKAIKELEIKGYIKAATLLDRFPQGKNLYFEAGPIMFPAPLLTSLSNRSPKLESLPLILACRSSIQAFWDSLPPEVKFKLEIEALSGATPQEKALMESDSRFSLVIKQDLMRLHAVRVMASLWL